MAAEKVVVGPWGGQGGRQHWSYTPDGAITHITITYDDVITTINFTSQDESGNSVLSQFGTHEGSNKAEIEIDPKVEKLRSISGTFGEYNDFEVVRSLSFTTNNKSYGPFGLATGSAFSFEVTTDSIIGFHGRCGLYLDAIGVYLNTKEREEAAEKVVVGPWGGQGGREHWSYIPDGAITRISITYDDVIVSIRFTSQDESGNSVLSEQFCTHEGSNKAEIEIDAKVEKLRSISGTLGEYNKIEEVITSLSFTTDKNKSYGPFGLATGSAFSFEATNDSIIGFHGHSGKYLDAIGVYLNPKASLSTE